VPRAFIAMTCFGIKMMRPQAKKVIMKKHPVMLACLLAALLAASPAYAQPNCAPRGQCAKNWWKGDECKCWHHPLFGGRYKSP
jgi:hypothetical protein